MIEKYFAYCILQIKKKYVIYMYTYIAFFKYVAISKYIWNIYTFSFSIQKWQEKKRYVYLKDIFKLQCFENGFIYIFITIDNFTRYF